MITTQGFTREAISFAKDENIKLVVLREFVEEDWEGKIKELHLNIKSLFMGIPEISFIPANEIEEVKMSNSVGGIDVVREEIDNRVNFFYDQFGNETENYQEVLAPIFNKFERIPGKDTIGEYLFDEVKYFYINNVLIGIKGFKYTFNSYLVEHKSVVGAGEMLGVLLLRYLDGSQEKIIFDKDISEWTFDNNG